MKELLTKLPIKHNLKYKIGDIVDQCTWGRCKIVAYTDVPSVPYMVYILDEDLQISGHCGRRYPMEDEYGNDISETVPNKGLWLTSDYSIGGIIKENKSLGEQEQNTNQLKPNTMNKFKHNFGVKGPVSLLRAFKQEAIDAGWKFKNTHSDESLGLYFNGSDGNKGCLKEGEFWKCGSFSRVKNIKLPQDWNEGTKMLTEKIKDYKVGEWLYFSFDPNRPNYGIFRYTKQADDAFYTDESHHIIGDSVYSLNDSNSTFIGKDRYINIVRATREQVEETLTKVAKFKGFTGSIKYNGVKDVVQGRYGNRIATCMSYNRIGMHLGSSFHYDVETDTLFNSGRGLGIIYEKGKWAEILPKEQVDGLIFGRRNVIVFKDSKVTFDEYTAKIEDVKAVYNWYSPSLKVGGFDFEPWGDTGIDTHLPVKIGCTTGTLDELEAIIKAYDELQ